MSYLAAVCLLRLVFQATPARSVILKGFNIRAADLRGTANAATIGDETSSLLQSRLAVDSADDTSAEQLSFSEAATTYSCTGEGDARSCLFKNLYYAWNGAGKGDFTMFVQSGQNVSGTEVLRADKYEGKWAPRVREFADAKEIDDFVASSHLLEQPGLSVHFNPLFHHNIGHALFDGLYPAYMALVRLGLHDKDFRPVVGVDAGCFDPGSPAHQGKLKPGDIVEAYLPHSVYEKTLQPSKVEILQVSETKTGASSDKTLCSFVQGYDSSAMDLGGQPVSGGQAGQSDCCKACEKTFGCTTGVIFDNFCYLKGNCPSGHCDVAKRDRFMCRFHEDRRPQVELTVRPLRSEASGGGVSFLAQGATIPGSWVVGSPRLRCMSEGIFETFGKSKSMLRMFEMDRDLQANQKILFRFDQIAIGSGGAGNLIADDSGAIGGSLDGAMAQFRDRMLEAYGLPVEQDKSSEDPNKPLDVIVVSNKRFSNEDQLSLASVIQQVSHPGKVNAEIVDWGSIGTPENRFREHLRRVQKADVYVSSIGTALQYVPFMKNQKVYIALGSVWQRSNQLFPTFMEQQLAGGGTPYLRTLYADPGAALRNGHHDDIGEDGYRANINGSNVLGLLGKAQTLVRQGFKIPVQVEDNLSREGNVLLQLCKQDPESCKLMNADRNGATYQCAVVLWPECVVYEVGPWRNECNVNRVLLRKLRKEYGLFSYGAPEM